MNLTSELLRLSLNNKNKCVFLHASELTVRQEHLIWKDLTESQKRLTQLFLRRNRIKQE